MSKELKKQSIKNNFIFQFLYQVITLVLPLVVTPLLTRKLGDTNLGIYSFANSVAIYFLLVINLGISNHGQRTISLSSHDKGELRRNFWSLFYLHSIIGVFVSVAYLFFCILFVNNNKDVFLCETILVVSAIFDITWFFYGLENFKSVVIKNAVIRVLGCILIFSFVKSRDDLIVYTIITASATFVGQIVMIPQALSIAKPIKVTRKDIISHLYPLLILSISVIAISLYSVFDKTLLGLLSTKENVAYYEFSNKIITVPRTFIAVIGTVMFPRACKLVADDNIEEQKQYLDISIIIVSFIGCASLFGIMAVSDNLAITYLGDSFEKCGAVLASMAALPIIVGMGNIVRTQFMIPNKLDKQYTICIVMNAIINLILSIVLIPQIGIFGAVIGTYAAELFGTISQTIICRKYISIRSLIKLPIPFFVIGLIMYFVIKSVFFSAEFGIKSLLFEIALGSVVYITLSFVFLYFYRKDILLKTISSFYKKSE